MKKYGFVYIWRDKKHKRYYIGSHWGTEDDGYVCSSNWMKQGYKHRPNDFKRRVLKSNIAREDLLNEEYKWLSMIKKEELKIKYYNLHNHHFNHWSSDVNSKLTVSEKIKKHHSTPEFKEQISKLHKGRVQSPENRKKTSDGLKRGYENGTIDRRIGRTISEKTRQILREKNTGKTHLEETKQKIRDWNKNNPYKHTEETKQKIRDWYANERANSLERKEP